MPEDRLKHEASPLLLVRDLSVHLLKATAPALLVDRVSFAIQKGETLALVGESGCGKTLTGLALLRLTPPSVVTEATTISFRGMELTRLSDRQFISLRGKEIAHVAQESLATLNPVYSVGEQVAEAIRHHEGVSRRDAWTRALAVLGEVGFPEPGRWAQSHPHELSGGMRQRVLLAIGLANRPSLLIADEPTAALDASLQVQLLDLLSRLQTDWGLAILLITHELGLAARLASRVAVMYAGQIVEEAATGELISSPRHPYTRALLGAAPRLEFMLERSNPHRLPCLSGSVPDAASFPSGCRLLPRCPHAGDGCEQPQELTEYSPNRQVRCRRAKELTP